VHDGFHVLPECEECNATDVQDCLHVLPECEERDVGDVHDGPSAELVAQGSEYQGVEDHAQP
jgi:hypothetical protein